MTHRVSASGISFRRLWPAVARLGPEQARFRPNALLLGLVLCFATPAAAQNVNAGAPAGIDAAAKGSDEERAIELSFKGADIDTVSRWLAEMTGKSVVKHKSVQCQLNILSPKKVPLAQAIQLVYRALQLEGFSALEGRNVIVIVPEAIEATVTPELIAEGDDAQGGKQMVVRIFQLQHATAASLKDKLRAVLSDKAKLEVDDRANKIIVTDFMPNVRFLSEVIQELDIATETDTVIEVFPLSHSEAAEMAKLVTAVFGDMRPASKPPQGPQQPGQPQPQPQPGQPLPPAPSAVKVLADNTSNRLVVTAPADLIPEIRELIQTLDAEKPADLGIRVIPLVHVDAEELVKEIGPMYGKLRGTSLKEIIEIAANDRSNSLIVLSSEENFRTVAKLVESLDTEEAENKLLRTFPLKHADAEDIAEQLDELYNTSGNLGWWGGRSEAGGRDKVKFVANRRRNEVIAIGPASSLERVEAIVATLDRPLEGEELAPRIYSLKYVGAEDVKDVLDELFLKKTQTRPYWWDDFSESEERDVGRLYGKVRIAAEPTSNSLIVTTNSLENFAALERVLDKLDRHHEENEGTITLNLRHAKAVSIANSLNILFAQVGAPPRVAPQQQQQRQNQQQPRNSISSSSMTFELEQEKEEDSFFPWLGGQQGQRGDGRTQQPVSDLVGKVRVVPDIRTNALLVTTSPHYFPQVLRVVKELDTPTAQVLIEARIIEVGRDDKQRLGVRWSPDGEQLFDTDDLDDSVQGAGTLHYLETFLGENAADAMRTGILGVDANLDLLIQFLVRNTESKVRAEPRINVADNERGKLFVGSRVPFISNSLNTAEGGRTDSFEYVDVGIILEVTPHINPDGQVDLSVRVESSQIRAGETLFGGAILDTRNYRTDLTIQSGKTLVLGGILQEEESEVTRKVPLLGDIPLLGWFFKKRDTVRRNVELMVFLRTTVTRTPEDVERLMEGEYEKVPAIRGWEDLKIGPPEDEK